MASTAIAFDILQALYVHHDLALEIALDLETLFDDLLQPIRFLCGQRMCSLVCINTRLLQYFQCARRTDAVDVRQRYSHLLVVWYRNTGNSWHIIIS